MPVTHLPAIKTQRLQVELPIYRIEELQRLMSISGITTQKDFVNNAITILEWAIEQSQKGNEVVSLNKKHKKYDVLVMPLLKHAAKFAANNRSQKIEDLREDEDYVDFTKIGIQHP
ncbi:MAG: hypothetical protein Q7T93_09095 [Methylobacterium sp.]|uniref:hypothetical protein n=1 Tax=Methylobacterium sp. TaxID=409 RepID=UPI002724B426|nr:hypothetical protein [Methylobacterium sp.]MDO9426981.1 hypothetical protein [Methylobacterium sp.]